MGALENKQHEEFCQQYIIDFNGAAAARRAKYSEAAARQQAHTLLTKTDIRVRIEELQSERAKRTQVSQDDVIYLLRQRAFANMGKFVKIGDDGLPTLDLSTCSAEDLALLSECKMEVVKTMGEGEDGEASLQVLDAKIKLCNPDKAIELLGKHLGMFTEKVEVTGLDKLADELRARRERVNKGK